MEVELTMNDIATRTEGTIDIYGSDPYAAYARKNQRGAGAHYLSFKNGEFLYGQSNTELPLGTQLLANMEGLRVGWRRWYNSQLTDDMTEPLIDRPRIPSREQLGDNDPSMWERDRDGRPRDPWVQTNVLDFIDANGDKYIFATSSKGGLGAIAELCEAYSTGRRQHPEATPVVEIGKDFYDHATYGKTYFPVFKVVGWRAPAELVPGQDEEEIPFDDPADRAPEKIPEPTKQQAKSKPRF